MRERKTDSESERNRGGREGREEWREREREGKTDTEKERRKTGGKGGKNRYDKRDVLVKCIMQLYIF